MSAIEKVLIETAQVPPRGRTGPGAIARRVAREPLVQFVSAGLILFAALTALRHHQSLYRIEVTPAHVAQLAREYELQFGAPPAPQTLNSLIRDDLQDEVLYREGLAQHLDVGDQIIRRRVIQKEQFVLQNLTAPAEPSVAELKAYLARHAAAYRTPPTVTFTHVFFSAAAGDAAAQVRARAVLRTLSGRAVSRAPDAGDPFPDLYDFSNYDPEQVERLFGQTPFESAVFAAPVGRWVGPVKSAYGWHLIYVSARTPSQAPSFDAVRDRLRSAYLQSAEARANAAAFRRLAAKFTIVRRDPGMGR